MGIIIRFHNRNVANLKIILIFHIFFMSMIVFYFALISIELAHTTLQTIIVDLI